MNLDQQNIIRSLGLESLPEERKIAVIEKMTTLLQKRLMVRMVTALDASKQAELADALENPESEAAQVFISQNFPDFPKWIEEETGKLKQEMASLNVE